ncbi:MAG: alcohol dehydrogenase catalytic domain-containing protein [Anaerolineae bacterium]|nr:alcohol dehydrogenase catalytic domain-containing protein [Anaerolineae bacterium]
MTDFERYRSLQAPVPERTWAWNMVGAGVENIGRGGKPELEPVPAPGPNQLLVRVDAVGMCFSDVKLIKQGRNHPKLYNRDLEKEPTRLGHEASLTVIQVGEALQDKFYPGQRLALQPDIYDALGRSTAYGYTIPGGLIQFHLIGPEVLAAGLDQQTSYVLSVEGDLGYAAAALTEPWACVEAAYTQRRRLEILEGGTMWILGHADDPTPYTFSAGLEKPTLIVLSNVPPAIKALVEAQSQTRDVRVIERNDITPETMGELRELTHGVGFDDMVVLAPRSATVVSAAAQLIARRGTFNMVGQEPLDALCQIDVGRMHYDYTAYLGNPGPDIAASYGEARNRCELRKGGVAVFVGAGGPMGQMHVQRAIELPDGPAVVLATDLNAERLAVLQEQFTPLAEKNHKTLIVFNPNASEQTLLALVHSLTEGQGADDVVVSVPVGAVMADAATLMKSDGMLNFFAGVPNGTYAPLNMSFTYLHNAQYTGTSGSTLGDQQLVIDKALTGKLSPNRSVAAVGGIEVAAEGAQAMIEGRYAGKIVIFPQLTNLPLMGLEELAEKYPEIGEAMGPEKIWTIEAERLLIETFWQG